VIDQTEGAGDPVRSEASEDVRELPTLNAGLIGGKDAAESASLSLSMSKSRSFDM